MADRLIPETLSSQLHGNMKKEDFSFVEDALNTKSVMKDGKNRGTD